MIIPTISTVDKNIKWRVAVERKEVQGRLMLSKGLAVLALLLFAFYHLIVSRAKKQGIIISSHVCFIIGLSIR